ncbi:hypothetical protein MKMG_01753 [Methanogenium sp. MK-MG]|nr:hypothetical protein MKMG_01753 [Methanogenium sp. MK-MG]
MGKIPDETIFALIRVGFHQFSDYACIGQDESLKDDTRQAILTYLHDAGIRPVRLPYGNLPGHEKWYHLYTFFSSLTIAESISGSTEMMRPTKIVTWKPERKVAESRSANATTPSEAVAKVKIIA